MGFDFKDIAKRFMVKKAGMGKISYGDFQIYVEGMVDVLDAIGDSMPEMVYSMHSIRNAIESAIDKEDEEQETSGFSVGDTVDVAAHEDCPTNCFQGNIVGVKFPATLSDHVLFTVIDQDGDSFDVELWQLSKVEDDNG
jgi:hypothetical protein